MSVIKIVQSIYITPRKKPWLRDKKSLPRERN